MTDGQTGTRGFLALVPDAGSRQALRRSRDALKRAFADPRRGVRWVESDALHLTLRFFGAASAAQVDYWQRALPALARRLPAIRTRRYAFWPGRARPRLLVLELEPDPALSGLARTCETRAREADFAPEMRRFRAHLTLARLHIRRAPDQLPEPPFSLRFDAIALMRSSLTKPAAIHTEIARVPLPVRASPQPDG